jgi:hypothetical protein
MLFVRSRTFRPPNSRFHSSKLGRCRTVVFERKSSSAEVCRLFEALTQQSDMGSAVYGSDKTALPRLTASRSKHFVASRQSPPAPWSPRSRRLSCSQPTWLP